MADASLNDILSAIKNITQAINNLGQTLLKYQGNLTSATLSGSAVLVVAGAGRLVSASVTVGGSANGTINNSATVGGAGAGNVLASIPDVIGIYPLGQQFTYGLVVTPGSGQSLNVTYYLT